MISVQSYPELFCTLIGWQQYQHIWAILTQTGLAFVPFLVLIVDNILQPSMSQHSKSASDTSLKRIEIHLITMILVIMLAAQPMKTLRPEILHYRPVCEPSVDATPGNSKTTYDKAFNIPHDVKVPLFWYTIMSISQGITNTLSTGIGCVPNYREMQTTLDTTRIEDPELRKEVGDFFKSCWQPAWNKYLEEKPDVKTITERYGNEDPQWIGSHVFQTLDGYYNKMYAPGAIKGFAYNSNTNYEQIDTHTGTPNCKEWWQDSNNGLYARLQEQIKPSFWDKWKGYIHSEPAKDMVIKGMIENSNVVGYQTRVNDVENAGGLGTGILGNLGLIWESMFHFPKMSLIVEALPLIQALLLMGCYMFLGFALPFSSYRISTVINIMFVIFSIIFWGFLWDLATYVDSTLMKAFFPPPEIGQFPKYVGGSELLISVILITLYILLPLFWTVFMGWAGVKVGEGVGSWVDRSLAPAEGAGGGLKNIASLGTRKIPVGKIKGK